MRSIQNIVIVLLLLGAVPALGSGPVLLPQQYQIDHWSVKHGLPHNSVNALLQTREGFIWIGTMRGVARFDGIRMRPIESFATRVPHLRNVLALAEGNDGSLWIGTDGAGVVRYYRDTLYVYDTRHGFPSNTVQCLAVDRQGRVYAGTSAHGVEVLSPPYLPATTTMVSELEGRDVRDISVDRSGRVWIASTGGGLQTLREDHGTISVRNEAMPDQHVYAVIANKGDTVIVSTAKGVFAYANGKDWLLVPPMPQAQDFYVSLCLDRDRNVWAGSYLFGLVRHRIGEPTSRKFCYTTQDGLAGNYIGCLLEDREGSIWIGTEDGLDRLSEATVQTIGEKEGLLHESMTGMAEDSSGCMWAATEEGGIFKIKDGQASLTLDARVGLPDGLNRSLCITRGGDLLIASETRGLFSYNGNTVRRMVEATSGLHPAAVLQASDGSIWLGTGRGVNHLSEAGETLDDSASRLQVRGVRVLYEDRKKSIWVGTESGLFRIQNGHIRKFTAVEGLPEEFISALLEDETGTLWVGTSSGLARFTNDTFQVFQPANGLFDGLITCILDDSLGYIWLGCPVGIMRIPRDDFDRVVKGQLARLRVQLFSTFDGMKSSECSFVGFPSGVRRKNGELWIATTRGIAIVDPRELHLVSTNYPVIIEDAVSGQQRRFVGEAVKLPEGDNNLTVNFSHPVFRTARQSEFHYQLEGFEKEWNDAGMRQSAIYTNLPPGSYVFKVMAVGRDTAAPAISTLPITIAPHFYQRPLFMAAVLVGLLLAIVTAHLLRTAGMKRQQHVLAKLVDERTSSLREEIAERIKAEEALRDSKEEIRSSLLEKEALLKEVHHRVKNNLTIVTSLLSLQGANSSDGRVQEVLRDAENRVRSLAAIHEMLYQSNNLAAIDFKPYIEGLVSRLTNAFGLPGISCSVNVQNVYLEVGRAIPCALIVNELVTNSLKHAFPHKKGGKIFVSLEQTGGADYRLVVTDDGVGAAQPPDPESATTLGLSLIGVLSSQLGGTIAMSFKGGTTCTVTFPRAVSK
jgi:two-component sensor histidine kinase/ligand-binding sensor domain-containing protein